MSIDKDILAISERLRTLRDIMELSVEEMAKTTDVTPETYLRCERGESDFSFTFLYKAAKRLGVDITDLLTGEGPTLSVYQVVRAGEGLPIERRHGFHYQNMAYLFRSRKAEPFIVTADYSEEEQSRPIVMNTHAGEEFDLILEGSLRVVVNGHAETLHPGDLIYYRSDYPHGMIAVGGAPCRFLAAVIAKNGDEQNA